jgi:hypothetical protein
MASTPMPQPIPGSYRRITPFVVVDGAAQALELYGDRDGHIVDPFGHHWTVATHVEDVAPDEKMRRMAKMAEGG